MMAVITTEDLLLPGVMTILSCYQLATFAMKVGKARQKYKVSPPDVDGPPEFQRAFRAQQNCLEFFPIYMGCLWTSSLFFHPVAAALVGLVYLYARGSYFEDYQRSAEARVPKFKLSANCLKLFLAMSIVGITQVFLHRYFGINLKELTGAEKFARLFSI